MSQSTALTVQFTGVPNTDPNKDKPREDEFHPSVFPWLYDPMSPNTWMNLIGPCDKWILNPWVGFEFHQYAIDYRNLKIEAAKKALPDMYKQAQDQYFKDWITFWNAQEAKKHNQAQATFNSNTNTKEPNVSYTIATAGVGCGYTSYSGTSSRPHAKLEIRFDPNADVLNDQKKDPNHGNSGQKCEVLDWKLFYQGLADWKWNLGEVYEQWKDDHTPETIQHNYYIEGSPDANGDEPNKRVKWWNGSKFVPFFCYYDTRYNSEKHPNSYSMYDLRFNWNKIIAPTETLAVYDLFRLWYVPDPINPIPVEPFRVAGYVEPVDPNAIVDDPSRVSNPPIRYEKEERPLPKVNPPKGPPTSFPAFIKDKNIVMRLAVGLIPPSGSSDSRVSWNTGTDFDITQFCKYHPDTGDNVGGRLEVTPFNFSNKLGSAIIKQAQIARAWDDTVWGQNGEHTLEIINIGTEATVDVHDLARIKIGKKQTLRKQTDLQYYVPSLDKGEYIYRKKWAVVNPVPSGKTNSFAYMECVYMKQYGHLGIKMVVDIYNPFDRDILFIPTMGTLTSHVESSRPYGIYYDNVQMLIPKTTGNNISKKRVTIFIGPYFSHFSAHYVFIPDEDRFNISTRDYSDTFVKLMVLPPYDNVGRPCSTELAYEIEKKSYSVCQLPTMMMIIKDGAIKEGVPTQSLPSLDNGSSHRQAFPSYSPVYRAHGLASGQPCTVDLYACAANGTNKAKTPTHTGVSAFCRVFDASFKTQVTAGYDLSYGVAYISKDIDKVYTNTPNPSRHSHHSMLYATGDGPAWFGGAVDTFVNKNDSQVKIPVRVNAAADNILIKVPPPNTWSDVNGGVVEENLLEEPWIPSDTGGWSTGNMQLDESQPATMECMFRGRIVEGWDDNPIEVVLPMFY